MEAVVKLSKYGKWRVCWVVSESEEILFVAIPYQETKHKKGITLQKGITESHIIYAINKNLITEGKVEIQYATEFNNDSSST